MRYKANFGGYKVKIWGFKSQFLGKSQSYERVVKQEEITLC